VIEKKKASMSDLLIDAFFAAFIFIYLYPHTKAVPDYSRIRLELYLFSIS